MKRHGLLHTELSALIAGLGHTDTFVVADRGLPVPVGVPMVDLAVVPGQVPFEVVLDAVLDEIVVQGHTIAVEATDADAGGSGAAGRMLAARAAHLGVRTTVSHEAFKELLPHVAFVVRTGEETPYANVLLECGVPF